MVDALTAKLNLLLLLYSYKQVASGSWLFVVPKAHDCFCSARLHAYLLLLMRVRAKACLVNKIASFKGKDNGYAWRCRE